MPQFDITTYLNTQDQPGGPVYLWEPEYPDLNEIHGEGPLTLGQKIGFLISLIAIGGVMVWMLTLTP